MTKVRTAELDALSAPRDGVVAHAELVKARFRHDFATSETAAGRWRRLLPGIYLRGSQPPTLRQRCFAALLHAGDKAVITGTAGCELRGVPVAHASVEVMVVVPRSVRVASSGFCRVVTTKELPESQLLQREGAVDLPVALVTRCVADAVRRAPDLAAARAIATSSLRAPGLDWDLVAVLSSRPGPGAGHLRRVVRDVADGVRSPAEADVHDVVYRAARRGGLPPYLLNPDVYVDGTLVGSPDTWFVGLGLGDEIDSRAFHEEVGALDATLLRHERFTTARLYLNHTTPARFSQDPRAHLRKLGALVADRGRLSAPEPPGLVVLGRGPLLPARSPWPQVDRSRWA